MRSHIKTHRVVPRYENIKFFDGLCEKFFKSSTMWGKVWLGVGTPLRQEGAGCCEKILFKRKNFSFEAA